MSKTNDTAIQEKIEGALTELERQSLHELADLIRTMSEKYPEPNFPDTLELEYDDGSKETLVVPKD